MSFYTALRLFQSSSGPGAGCNGGLGDAAHPRMVEPGGGGRHTKEVALAGQ